MVNLILVIASFGFCIFYAIYAIRRNKIWDEEQDVYSNIWGLRAFIMSIILGICFIIILIKG